MKYIKQQMKTSCFVGLTAERKIRKRVKNESTNLLNLI